MMEFLVTDMGKGILSVLVLSSGCEQSYLNMFLLLPGFFMRNLLLTLNLNNVGLAGEPIGFYSAPLKQIARELHASSQSSDSSHQLSWIELSEPMVSVLINIIIISVYFWIHSRKGEYMPFVLEK